MALTCVFHVGLFAERKGEAWPPPVGLEFHVHRGDVGEGGKAGGVRFRASHAEAGAGQLLAVFHGRLVNRVDAHEPAGEDGGGFEEHHHLAGGFSAGIGHVEMHGGHVLLGQRGAGGDGFGFEHITEGLAAQVLPLGRHFGGDGQDALVGRRADKEADLVLGAVEEHLKQGVLVGHAGSRDGLSTLAVLAEAFGPELAEPGAEGGPGGDVAEIDDLALAGFGHLVGPAGELPGGMVEQGFRVLGKGAANAHGTLQKALPVHTFIKNGPKGVIHI